MNNNFWYPNLTTRTYFTMMDIAELAIPAGDWRGWDLEAMADRKIGVYEFINHFASDVKDTTYTKTLFTDYIWPKFWQEVLLYVDNAPEGDEWTYNDIRDAWNKKAGLIFGWINESKEVYEVLISQLEINKAKLLDQIKSTTKSSSTTSNDNRALNSADSSAITTTDSRTNDTPQSPGPWDEDDYVSVKSGSKATSTSATSSNNEGESHSEYDGETTVVADSGTMMARLKEIQDNLSNLYGKWAKEFRRFIIFSA